MHDLHCSYDAAGLPGLDCLDPLDPVFRHAKAASDPRTNDPGTWEAAVWAALDRRLDSASPEPLALALSGGGDSLALLLLTVAWARVHCRRVLALTVDHGLHPESAAWTVFAGEAARARGCDWRALAWRGDKPRAGLPAAARAARHALLAEAARAAGARVILTGHTADDALEGELMRVADAPTLGRLREWRPSPAWPEGRGLFLLSPLLSARRAALRAWLREQGAEWIDDPANEDPRFARPRARARLALHSLPPAERGGCAGALPPGEGGQAGVLTLKARGFSPTTLSAALLCAAGASRPPRSAQVARLMARILAGERFTAALSGARLEADDGEVRVMREPGEQERAGLQPVALTPGEPAVWDGRFELLAHAPGLTVVPLAGHAARLADTARAGLAFLPPAARAALPALVDAAGGVSLPAPFGMGPASARALAPERFAAATDLILDEATLRRGVAGALPHGAAPPLILS